MGCCGTKAFRYEGELIFSSKPKRKINIDDYTYKSHTIEMSDYSYSYTYSDSDQYIR